MNGTRRFVGSPVFQALMGLVLVIATIFGVLGYQHFFGNDTTVQPNAKPAATASAKTTESTDLALALVTGNETEKQRQIKDDFNEYLVDNPALNCADGRNAGLTWRQIDKIRPCVNGSIHLRLQNGELKLVQSSIDESSIVFGNTTIKASKQNCPEDSSKKSCIEDSPELGDKDWRITLREDVIEEKTNTDSENPTVTNKTVYLIGYDYKQSFKPFVFYAKVAGGKWETQTNLNDYSWDADKVTDFVFTWQDPSLPLTDDAPVPFKWSDVSKHYYMPAA